MQSQTVFTVEMFDVAAQQTTDEGQKRRIEEAKEAFIIIADEKHHADMREQARTNIFRWKQAKQLDTEPCSYVTVREGDWGAVTGELTRTHGEIFAVLNMANADIPGGGLLVGNEAQEPNMFRRTDIYRTVTDKVAEVVDGAPYYTQTARNLITGQDGLVLLSPEFQVCFRDEDMEDLDNDEIFPFYELRSAAVKYKKNNFYEEEMRERIKAQLQTLKNNGIRHVVLGAFGCGAFRNPAEKVAKLYKEQLESEQFQDAFDQVHFAIHVANEKERKNLEAFERILGNNQIELKKSDPSQQVLYEYKEEGIALNNKQINLKPTFESALNEILESQPSNITPEMVKELYAQTKTLEHSKQLSNISEKDFKDMTFNEKLAQLIVEVKVAPFYIPGQPDKLSRNKMLSELLKKETNIQEMNALFVLAKNIEDLNQHKHRIIDFFRGFGFFTWKPINTKTWRDTMGVISQHGLDILKEKQSAIPECLPPLDKNPDFKQRVQQILDRGNLCAEQNKLLTWAKTAPIFAHRNNSIFAGAYGDTKTVGEIKNMLSAPKLK